MLTAQLTSAAALTLLLFGFYQRFGKGYLRHWAWSWAALTVAHALQWSMQLPLEESLLRYVLSAGYLSATALSLIWFLFGVYEVTRHYSVRLRVAAATTPITIVAAAIFAFFLYDSARLLEGALLLPTSLAAIGASGWTLYSRGKRGAPGLVLFSLTLLALGVVSLLDGYLLVARLPPSSSLTLMTFACHVAVGLAMIIALLDDEREAAVMAASEIEHLAYNDPLTGLSNRSLFLDRTINALAQATRQHHSVSVLFLDIDRFKTVNDSLGHSFGDALLKAAANRIRDCVRPGDTVARFGGDEFTILLPRVDTVAEASSIAYRILAALRKPFLLAGRELVVTTSIGISLYPADGLDAETLVKNADIAMYRAKEKGRDNCQLFTPELSSRALEKLDLENRLRRALENNELLVFYQPLINVHKQTLYGFEALLRWQHPELGLLAPGSFIEAAERLTATTRSTP
jgi:diguanylate cyclase (GGDEF)-like protein